MAIGPTVLSSDRHLTEVEFGRGMSRSRVHISVAQPAARPAARLLAGLACVMTGAGWVFGAVMAVTHSWAGVTQVVTHFRRHYYSSDLWVSVLFGATG